MISALKNTYVQGVLLFVLIVGGYALYVNVTHTENVSNTTEQISADMEEANVSQDDEAADKNTIDLTGTHIMPDGSVMTGSGLTLPDATVLPDGTIELSNGDTLTPVADFRK